MTGKCEIFKSFRGSAPDPAGAYSAPPPPPPQLEKGRAAHNALVLLRNIYHRPSFHILRTSAGPVSFSLLQPIMARYMRLKIDIFSTNFKEIFRARLVMLLARDIVEKAFNRTSLANIVTSGTRNTSTASEKKFSIGFLAPILWLAAPATSPPFRRRQKLFKMNFSHPYCTWLAALAPTRKLGSTSNEIQTHFWRQNRD